jgi:hypothetical protein
MIVNNRSFFLEFIYITFHLKFYMYKLWSGVPPEASKMINKLERSFLWTGTNKVSGEQCKFNWKTICRPQDKGSLDIMDLDKFAKALYLWWHWLWWKDPSKTWIGDDHPCDKTILICSIRSLPSQSVMGVFKLLASALVKGENQRILCHLSLQSLSAKTSQCINQEI